MANIILSTKRLNLRTWEPGDVALMAAISADPVVMEHFPAPQDRATTEALIERIHEHYEKSGYCLYAVEIKATREFIGFVGLNQPAFDIPHFVPKGLPIVEIGWRLAAKHWGKGYATEAAKAVLQDAFTKLNLKEIIAFTVVDNMKSRHVMEKIGLHHDKADDFNHTKLPENHPFSLHVLYRLTKEEYDLSTATK